MLGQECSAAAVTVALGRVVKKKVIETVSGEDDSGVTTSRYGSTTAGMEWLISHKDMRWPTAQMPPSQVRGMAQRRLCDASRLPRDGRAGRLPAR